MKFIIAMTTLFLFPIDGFGSCGPTPVAATDLSLNSYYSDEHKSTPDPGKKAAYDLAVAPIETLKKALCSAGAGSSSDKRTCALQWLDTWTTKGALTGKMEGDDNGFQSEATRRWTLASVALSYGKLKDFATPEQQARIESWLKKLADKTIDYLNSYYKGSPSNVGRQNNHYYWGGLAVTAVGAVTGDPKYMAYGKSVFSDAMNSVQSDGSLKQELLRGKRALFYHAFAAEPLVMTSALLGLNSPKLDLLVSYVADGVSNPQNIQKQIPDHSAQEPLPGYKLAWANVYLRHKGNSKLSQALDSFGADQTASNCGLGGDLRLKNPLEATSPSLDGGSASGRKSIQ